MNAVLPAHSYRLPPMRYSAHAATLARPVQFSAAPAASFEKHILLLEDEPTMQKMLARLLGRKLSTSTSTVYIHTASSPAEAERQWRHHGPMLVLFDYDLHGCEKGIDFVKGILNDPEQPAKSSQIICMSNKQKVLDPALSIRPYQAGGSAPEAEGAILHYRKDQIASQPEPFVAILNQRFAELEAQWVQLQAGANKQFKTAS